MATFEYQALTDSGRLMQGTIEAGSVDQAGEFLRQMKLQINSLTQAKPARAKTPLGRNEFLLFNQQLAAITKAGIPLEKAFRELAADISSSAMRKKIDQITRQLEKGEPLEKVFTDKQAGFPPLYGHILQAGIETGRLSEMLTSLNRHLEMTRQTRRILFEALCYPVVVLILAMVIISGVFLFVIPNFKTIFQDFGTGLPAMTLFILNLADNVIPFWITTGIILVAFILVWSALSTTKRGRYIKESILFKIPFIGRVYHSSALSRFADAMALLVGSGAALPRCLCLGGAASGSEIIKLEAKNLAQQIEQGTTILEAGQFCSFIPRLLLYSVQLGIQRNELQDNLYSLSDMYTNQTRSRQSRLSAGLMPIMIIFIGAVITFTVTALFMPMVNLISCFSG